MRLKDALEMHARSTDPLPTHAKYLGIRLGKVLITPEMLESSDWGYVIENNDPKFAETLKGLVEILKEEGPICELNPGLHIVK